MSQALLLKFISYVKKLLGEDDYGSMDFFSYLLKRLALCCYASEWHKKLGSCKIIRLLVSLMPKRFLRLHIHLLMRALFFSLKDVEDELLKNVEEEINVTVDYVWKIFLSIGSPFVEDSQDGLGKDKLGPFMISQLSSSSESVRLHAQKLLLSLDSNILKTLFSQNQGALRALLAPRVSLLALFAEQQISHCAAVSFCLSLQPSPFRFANLNSSQ
jgi:hypothetical protein